MNRTGGARRDPRVGEVREREEPGQPLGPEVPAAEPEDRKRPERHHDDLRERERERRGPEIHSGASSTSSGSTCDAEPNDLLTGRAVRRLQQAPLRRAPDRLHHVPEVEAAEPEVRVRRRARSRTEQRVHTTIAPQIASDHAWSRTASTRRAVASAARRSGRAVGSRADPPEDEHAVLVEHLLPRRVLRDPS